MPSYQAIGALLLIAFGLFVLGSAEHCLPVAMAGGALYVVIVSRLLCAPTPTRED